MTYSKPEVKTLGEAMTVIEALQEKIPIFLIEPVTGKRQLFLPAYDLDE
jgi:hypothetical protein